MRATSAATSSSSARTCGLAVFDESAFTDDEASQYDLDVHAILDLPAVGLVLTLNHYGMVRAFDGDEVAALGPARRVTPIWTQDFAADVERYAIVGERLVGSRPREQRSAGLLVSEPLRHDGISRRLELTGTLESWGMAHSRRWAPDPSVGGDSREHRVHRREGRWRSFWDVAVEFEPAVLVWDGR